MTKALTEFRAIFFVLTCSPLFEKTNLYTKNHGISASVGWKRKLVADAIPKIGVVLGC